MNPQDQHDYPVDYLNSIAPTAQKKGFGGFGFDRRTLFIISLLVGALLLAIVFIVVGSTIKNNRADTNERLYARLSATATIAKNAQKNLKDSKLRALNSNLNLYLTNTSRDIVEPLTVSGVNLSKIDKTITSEESGSAIVARLENARLNSEYDRTYAREMAYQLETIMALMNQIHSSNASTALKTYLEKTYNDLEAIQKDFADYNSATT